MTSVCIRCGDLRTDYRQICPRCGLQPSGEGLLLSWLASSQYLNEEEMARVSERIRAGEALRPSVKQLVHARLALGQHLSSDPGMTRVQRFGLLATSLILTPMLGWVLWFWWRDERPRSALQALGLSLPASVIFFGLVVWLRLAPPGWL